jgi:diphthamide synthase subunit DPH2
MTLNPQFITDDSGKRKAVILTMKEYEILLGNWEEMEDERLFDKAIKEKDDAVPFEEYLKEFDARK